MTHSNSTTDPWTVGLTLLPCVGQVSFKLSVRACEVVLTLTQDSPHLLREALGGYWERLRLEGLKARLPSRRLWVGVMSPPLPSCMTSIESSLCSRMQSVKGADEENGSVFLVRDAVRILWVDGARGALGARLAIARVSCDPPTVAWLGPPSFTHSGGFQPPHLGIKQSWVDHQDPGDRKALGWFPHALSLAWKMSQGLKEFWKKKKCFQWLVLFCQDRFLIQHTTSLWHLSAALCMF